MAVGSWVNIKSEKMGWAPAREGQLLASADKSFYTWGASPLWKLVLNLDFPFPWFVLSPRTFILRTPKPKEIRKRSSFKKLPLLRSRCPRMLFITICILGNNENCSHHVHWTPLKSFGNQRELCSTSKKNNFFFFRRIWALAVMCSP